MARRGSYAKGVAKREEILRAALDVVAREGYRGASVKQIADAVGLSQAGLLHYFDSKEELFTEILHIRDEVDQEAFGSLASGEIITFEALAEGYVRVVRHNAEVPGLVHLFSQLAVDAADPAHPAHAYFASRATALREAFGEVVARAQQQGLLTDAVPAPALARMVQAVSDGAQLQWMLEPDAVDMAEIVDSLFAVLRVANRAGSVRERSGTTPRGKDLHEPAP